MSTNDPNRQLQQLRQLDRVMARTLAQRVQAGGRESRNIQSQLTNPANMEKQQRLAARNAIYGVDQRARQLANTSVRRPIGDLEARAGEAQKLRQQIQAMDVVAGNVGMKDFGRQTQKRIAEAQERTRKATRQAADEFAQGEVAQRQIAQAFALMNQGDGLAAFSFRSAEAQAADLAGLAKHVPTNLVERAAANAGLAHSPARNALIQKAIAAEALARFAQEARAEQVQAQEQAHEPTLAEGALSFATFGLIAADANDDLVADEVVGMGSVISLAVAPVELGLELGRSLVAPGN